MIAPLLTPSNPESRLATTVGQTSVIVNSNKPVSESASASQHHISYRERQERHILPFLRLVHGEDDPQVTLQTYNDKDKDDPELRRLFHGPFSKYKGVLGHFNAQGAAICKSANPTDGKGRGFANVTEIVVYFADLDDKYATKPFNIDELPLKPSCVVKTKNGWHIYLVLKTPVIVEPWLIDEYHRELKAIQRVLEPFGADPTVCQINRVLRVPGYYHRKTTPALVELESITDQKYTRDEIREAFDIRELPSLFEPESPPMPRAINLGRDVILKRAAAYCRKLPASVQGSKGGPTLYRAALRLQDGFDLSETEAVSIIVGNLHQTPAWPLKEIERAVRNSASKCSNRGHLL
ncbi:MAG: hypothetical protein FWG02_05200 [Holophagaceae bacterium]|nr:hypothetical protein [Holophagaceae bacterium]